LGAFCLPARRRRRRRRWH